MATEIFLPLYVFLSARIVLGMQDGLSVPEIKKVYADEGDVLKCGVWKLNVEWRDDFTEGNKPDKVSYDVEIFRTEQMMLVHNETIEVKPNLNETHQWSWTSPIPLQCTSHSVRMRASDGGHTSDWTPFKILPGITDNGEIKIYPQDHVVLVGDPIVLCCVLTSDSIKHFNSSDFKIQISNRTYITDPIIHQDLSPKMGFDIECDSSGSTYYTGYAPDVQNLNCETRNLIDVECSWNVVRETGLSSKVKNVEYSINGRKCSPNNCVLEKDVEVGVMNWTLIAENVLGKKIISDAANPKHRVRLNAPVLAPATMTFKRNATLKWNWNGMLKHNSFPMTCEVEVNGLTVKVGVLTETFNGTGLESLVLTNLQPFTEHTARVRCGSYQHFYKWGDWSNAVTFKTEEDIPEALDVWMHVFDGQTYVMWKELNLTQSHGEITGYELDVGDVSKDRVTSTTEHCYKLSSTDRDQVISVSAKNSAGVSPPSVLVIPKQPSEGVISTSGNYGQGGGFNVSWEPSPVSSCGYVVDWFPTYGAKECAVKWMKIPSGVTQAIIHSDFEDGVSYTLSIYACTPGAPQLLQRIESYVKELSPSACVGHLKARQNGPSVVVFWEEVPKDKQRGFIKNYVVSYKLTSPDGDTDQHEEKQACEGLERECKMNLDIAAYTFNVTPFTSAGKGMSCQTTLSMDLKTDEIIIGLVIALAGAVCVFTSITALCYRKRKWLKSALYPDIPKPRFADEFFTKEAHQCRVIDQVLLAESEMLMMRGLELCPQVIPKLQYGKELDALISLEPLQQDNEYAKNAGEPQVASAISMDSFYTGIPSTGIQNPSYNLILSLPDEVYIVSGYMPQTQSADNQLQHHDSISAPVISAEYKPQAVAHPSQAEISNNNSLPFNSTLISTSDYLHHNM